MLKNLPLGLCFAGVLTIGLFGFSLAQPTAAGLPAGTPLFLPLVLQMLMPTKAPTHTATATATASDTPIASATPTAGHTPTITDTPTETSTAGPAVLFITVLSGDTMPEYVQITNVGQSNQNMTGWSIVSVVGPQTYNFPDEYVLLTNASVQVQSYNGATNHPPTVLLWNSDQNWNDAGDKAELRDNSNMVIDDECYLAGCP
jgi:hypothetical protein